MAASPALGHSWLPTVAERTDGGRHSLNPSHPLTVRRRSVGWLCLAGIHRPHMVHIPTSFPAFLAHMAIMVSTTTTTTTSSILVLVFPAVATANVNIFNIPWLVHPIVSATIFSRPTTLILISSSLDVVPPPPLLVSPGGTQSILPQLLAATTPWSWSLPVLMFSP